MYDRYENDVTSTLRTLQAIHNDEHHPYSSKYVFKAVVTNKCSPVMRRVRGATSFFILFNIKTISSFCGAAKYGNIMHLTNGTIFRTFTRLAE